MPDADSPEAALPEKKRRRWRVRWSLRALVGFVFLVALVLMVLTHWHRTGQQHEAVAENFYNQQWGTIEWRYQFPVMPIKHIPTRKKMGVGFYRIGAPRLSPWVIRIGGEPMFQRIERIVINRRSAQELEAPLAEVARIGSLADLSLYFCKPSESQLKDLMAHTSLESLSAEGAQIGRGRLPFLNHPGLKYLSLGRTQFSNLALDDLPISLTHLDLRRTRITDEGLGKFVRLKNLEKLVLDRTPTSEEAIERLRAQMPWCEIGWEPLLEKHLTRR